MRTAALNLFTAVALIAAAFFVVSHEVQYPPPPPPPKRIPQDCTPQSPCVWTGTASVLIPYKRSLCFEEGFWDELPRMGFMVTNENGVMVPYLCTKQQARNGTCRQSNFWAFKLSPQPGYPPPKFWLVPYGSKGC